jgi:hypothetical protein
MDMIMNKKEQDRINFVKRKQKKRDNLMPMYKGLPDFVAKNEKRDDFYKVNEDKLASGLEILEEIDPELL